MSKSREYIYTEAQLTYLCTAVCMSVLEMFASEGRSTADMEDIMEMVLKIPSEEWESAYYTIAVKHNK